MSPCLLPTVSSEIGEHLIPVRPHPMSTAEVREHLVSVSVRLPQSIPPGIESYLIFPAMYPRRLGAPGPCVPPFLAGFREHLVPVSPPFLPGFRDHLVSVSPHSYQALGSTWSFCCPFLLSWWDKGDPALQEWAAGGFFTRADMQSELFFGCLFPHSHLQEDQGVYQSKVRDMISENQYRLIVNINDLRRKNEKRASRWVWGTRGHLGHWA